MSKEIMFGSRKAGAPHILVDNVWFLVKVKG